MRSTLLLCLSVIFCFTGVVHADATLKVSGEPGSFIAGGVSFEHTYAESELETAVYSSLLLIYADSVPAWSLWIKIPDNDQGLVPACYERAQRATSGGPRSRPGIDFTFNSAGCNVLGGRFKLFEMTTDANSGSLSRLAVDFVQHCEGQGPATYGKLRYNSLVPLDTPDLSPMFTTTGEMHYVSEAGDVIGGGGEESFPLDRFVFRVDSGSGNGILARYQTTSSPERVWTLGLAAADFAQLTPGSYRDAQGYPSQQAGHPGLAYSLDNYACGEVGGQFDISSISRDRIDGILSSMDATFVQRCEYNAPALRGDLNFVTQFENGPFVADVIHIEGFDNQPNWPLVWDCF